MALSDPAFRPRARRRSGRPQLSPDSGRFQRRRPGRQICPNTRMFIGTWRACGRRWTPPSGSAAAPRPACRRPHRCPSRRARTKSKLGATRVRGFPRHLPPAPPRATCKPTPTATASSPFACRDDQRVPHRKKVSGGFFMPSSPARSSVHRRSLGLRQHGDASRRGAQGMEYGAAGCRKGIWNFFGFLLAPVWLWAGDGDKAARLLYAFANHASPLFGIARGAIVGRARGEDLRRHAAQLARAEFIRLVRHLLASSAATSCTCWKVCLPPGPGPERLSPCTTSHRIRPALAGAASRGVGRYRAALESCRPAATRRGGYVLHLGPWAEESIARKSIELPAAGRSSRRCD